MRRLWSLLIDGGLASRLGAGEMQSEALAYDTKSAQQQFRAILHA